MIGDRLLVLASGLLLSTSCFAQEPTLDKADTAWVLISTGLVLLMTIPGVALFYAGMARKKNMLSLLAQSTVICCALSVVWYVVGYSLAFAPGNAWIGDFSMAFLNGIEMDDLTGTVPTFLYVIFQMTFAVLAGAITTGAFAGRMKFSSMLVYMILWSLLVYAPICHWAWSTNGIFMQMGVLDFAGGTVVHINAGVAGLIAAIMLGKRLGFGEQPMAPHNLTFAMIGACLLWVGWFGFNGGSALAADGRAVMAVLVSQIAAAAAGLSWMICEWTLRGKASLLGLISGAVAGLVVITPASGFVLPDAALFMGLIGGAVCYWGTTWFKRRMGWDDSMDAFGIHGIGGIVGALLTAFFATSVVTGSDLPSLGELFTVQAISVVATLVYTAVVCFILLKIIDLTMGLRIDAVSERQGLDLAEHGERIQ